MSHAATNWAISQRGFKPATKIVLWHLCDRYNPDNGCFPAQETLAFDCEMSRSALNEHLDILEEAGLIAREQQRERGSQKQLPTRYRFAFEAGFTPVRREKPCAESGHGSGDQAVSGNGAEPCPENDDSRVRNPDSNPVREPVKEPVRERARESGPEEGQAAANAGESREAIERAFLRWWPTWPTYPAGSEAATRKAWFALNRAERQACIDRTPDFIAKIGPRKKDYTFAHVYLAEKHWERLGSKAAAEARPELVRPLGKAGMATRFSELMKPMATLMPPAPLLVRQIIERGGEAAEREIAARRERYGWPKVYEMNEKALAREGMVVSPDMVLLGADFVSVTLDGPVGQAWKRLFERQQLPWLRHPPETEYAYFPPLPAGEADLDKAVAAAFWAFKRKVEGDVHAAAE